MIVARRWARGAAVAALLLGGVPAILQLAPAHASTPMAFGMASGFSPSPTQGINFSAGDVARVASDIHSGGLLRIEVSWAELQPNCTYLFGMQASNDTTCQMGSLGPIVWSPLDAALGQIGSYLTSGALKLLIVVDSAPQWAQSWGDQPGTASGGTAPDLPPANDAWAQGKWQTFVAAMVKHIETAYPAALAGLEVWNEENGTIGWSTNSGPDPARYTVILCDAYTAVRSVDGSLPVILGGLNEETPTYPTQSIKQYLGQAYADGLNGQGANIRRCMTSIGVHPYSGTDPATGGQFAQALQDASVAAAAGGDPGRALSITEYGTSVSDFSPAQQAQWEVDGYTSAQTYTPNNLVNMFIVYSAFDQRQFDSGLFGVCSSPGQPRPAATALKQLLSGNASAQENC